VQGPPNGIAPYAEAMAATINQNCNSWQLSPAASVLERSVIAWLMGLFSYGDEAGGILTSGSSIATLNALTTALNDRVPAFRDAGLQAAQVPLVVYTSQEAHQSVGKAVALLSLGLDSIRRIPTDAGYRCASTHSGRRSTPTVQPGGSRSAWSRRQAPSPPGPSTRSRR